MLFEYEWDYDNWERLGYPEYMEENNDEHLEAYNLEKMDPKERWEQGQLNEFEGFAALEQLFFTQDVIEQEISIKALEEIFEEEREEISQEQLLQIQLWEHAVLTIQQLHEK